MSIKIELINTEMISVFWWMEVIHNATFEMIRKNYRSVWTFVFRREPISGIAYVKDVKKIEQDNQDYKEMVVSNDEIEDMLEDELNK